MNKVGALLKVETERRPNIGGAGDFEILHWRNMDRTLLVGQWLVYIMATH